MADPRRMVTHLAAVSIAFFVALPLLAGTESLTRIHESLSEKSFVENIGQWDASIRYRASVREGTVSFDDEGCWITTQNGGTSRWNVRVAFVDAASGASVHGLDANAYRTSYFTGPRKNWSVGAHSYRILEYRDVWPGIDVTFRIEGGSLKYAFVVAPWADASRIRLRYEGATSIETRPCGELRIAAGASVLEDQAPVACQSIESAERHVAVAFHVESEGDASVVSFDLGPYRSDCEK